METNESKKIGQVTKAVKDVFEELPETFYGTTLIDKVREKLERPTFDGTISAIMRRLRLRDSKKYGYECIDNHKSKYKKMVVETAYGHKN